MIENCLFLLISLGLDVQKASDADLKATIASLNEEQWVALRMLSEKQGVAAIAFDGLSLLIEKYGYEQIAPNINKEWIKQYVLEWMGLMLQIEQLNKKQQSVMNTMAEQWKDNGCRVMVFKGQASGLMYPKPNHRSPGDIDCYLFGDYAKGNEIARKMGADVDESWYKHSVISYQEETFENHQYLICTRGGRRKKLLEKELERELDKTRRFSLLTQNIVLPPDQWLAMFLTYHSCAHFLSEGLRMKQLLDWAILLKTKQDTIEWNEYYEFCERHHFRRFIDAATAICVNRLGVGITASPITATSPYEEKLIQSMLYDDDYVHSSGESAWRNRWHLVSNLFRYRWKYDEIYQESVWMQLLRYARGYLFHTE